MKLAPCPSCARHVSASSNICPFCGEATPELRPRRGRSVKRLSRAAMVAFGATLAAAGCDSGPAAIYGGPPEPEAIANPYGAPPMEDVEPEPEPEPEPPSESESEAAAEDELGEAEGALEGL